MAELSERKTKTIGVLGLGRAVGTTHSSILISNYLSACMRKKVALLECNSSKDYEKIYKIYNNNVVRKVFSMALVDYYPEFMKEDYAGISDLYDYIIMDFGNCLIEHRDSFIRCDTKLFVTAFTEWRVDELLKLLQYEEENVLRNSQFIYIFGDEKTRKKISSLYKYSFTRMPYIENAYALNEELYNLLSSRKISI